MNRFTYQVFEQPLSSMDFGKKTIVNTINQYSFCIAEQDLQFKEALLQSDILLPDGVAITWAYRFLYGRQIRKIAGADLHHFCLTELNKTGGRCFYLGASAVTLQLITTKMNKDFPNVQVGTYSPPFKSNFSAEENEAMIAAVNAFKPDVLFIGMTAPKQEKWLHQHKHQLHATIIGSIGAVFDFYAGTVQRPAPIWIKMGLEWLARFFKEPKRMWRRYFYYGPVYLKYLMEAKFQSLR